MNGAEVLIVLVFLAFLVLYFIRLYNKEIAPAILKSKANKLKKYVTFDESKGVLTVHQRSSQIHEIVTIANAQNMTISHEPETTHIGAVTVGGVTTGGTYKTGGYDYVSSSSKSQYCELLYAGRMVRSISLTSDDFEKAREDSNISHYIRDGKIQLMDYSTMSSFDRQFAMLSMANGIYDDSTKKMYPSYEKCNQILKWICNE